MVRSLMHMLHDTYETLYNSSECEEVTNVIFHFNPLNGELNPISHLLALLGAHHILHVSRIRVK